MTGKYLQIRCAQKIKSRKVRGSEQNFDVIKLYDFVLLHTASKAITEIILTRKLKYFGKSPGINFKLQLV